MQYIKLEITVNWVISPRWKTIKKIIQMFLFLLFLLIMWHSWQSFITPFNFEKRKLFSEASSQPAIVIAQFYSRKKYSRRKNLYFSARNAIANSQKILGQTRDYFAYAWALAKICKQALHFYEQLFLRVNVCKKYPFSDDLKVFKENDKLIVAKALCEKCNLCRQ